MGEPEKAAAKRRGRFHVVEDAEAGGSKAGASAGAAPRPTVSRNASVGARRLTVLGLSWYLLHCPHREQSGWGPCRIIGQSFDCFPKAGC